MCSGDPPNQARQHHEGAILKRADESHDQTGLIFDIQRFSIHDGPGIRTTVFMKGCPLRCQWCSNPESIKPYPEIMTYDLRCNSCSKCLEVCPVEAIELNETIEIDRAKCNRCMECAQVCYPGAIKCAGKYMSVAEVVEEVEKDRPFYNNSGGGVTASGGEPLLQWEFVATLFKKCQEKHLHTALDTTGYAKWPAIKEVLKYTDLVLFDIKHMDPLRHREGTGRSNALILSNAKKVAGEVRTWLRFPVLPGYNDSMPHIRELAEFGLKCQVEKVSLIPYHRWGESKYQRLGREYLFEGVEPPTSDHLEGLKRAIEAYGLEVTIGN